MKKSGPLLVAAAAIVAVFGIFVLGLWIVRQPASSVPQAPPAPEAPAPTAPGTVKIASFNIQVFGTSKLKKPDVMDVLAKTIRRFDVVAIQEVRSSDRTVMDRFLALVNQEGGKYDYVLGPRLGRTSSKEQYAFVFNTETVELDRGSVYTVGDPQDLLHREPLVATFSARGPPFTLVNVHTDPDEAATELDALADIFTKVQKNHVNAILVGDLNVDERHLGRLGQLPGIFIAIRNQPTNTRRDKTYDNLIFSWQFTGRSGVLDVRDEYGLTLEKALEVSDHFPVWAEIAATPQAEAD